MSKAPLVALTSLALWIVITTTLGSRVERAPSSYGAAQLTSIVAGDSVSGIAVSDDLVTTSRVIQETIPSASLKRDLPVSIYVPAGYAAGTKRYSVLYLLHGAGGDQTDWTGHAKVQEVADRLIGSGAIPPTIIVMPGLPGCWWVDGAKDKAETAFWTDLVPAVDSRYRTIKSRDGRLLAGLSAGGYGAIRFGLKYPERMAAVAALSPAVYADAPPLSSAARTQPPFLDATGHFNDAMWDANNYPSLLPAYFRQPHRVAVYLASGDDDTLGIAYETALLHKRLVDRQPGLTEFRVLDGGHDWQLWSRTLADAMVYVFRHANAQVAVQRPASAIVGASGPITAE